MNSENWEAEQESLRLRSAMVLFALERSLGDFVVGSEKNVDQLPATILREIEGRRGDKADTLTVGAAVQATYIDEIFQLALAVAQETSSHQHLRDLRALCEVLDIFEIRNAVSHPNRRFPECYWHRMAAIATDHRVEIVGLTQIVDAFRKAQKGIIESPPEAWLRGPVWEIQNNLPDILPHAVTGLIGREKPMRSLGDLLTKPRANVLAVTGPGGIGKTALVLQKLHEIVHTPESLNVIDGVWFLSLKLESLTATGIEPLSSAGTLAELTEALLTGIAEVYGEPPCSDLKELRARYESKRLIVFIDNLESVLRDNPESFESFMLDLPATWKVVVTSRIRVENAITIPLPELSEGSAQHLARKYAGTLGVPLREDEVSRIASSCNRNPLAIRLTIDRCALGHELSAAISSTKSDVTTFSYSRLIEALSDTSVKILECLFAKDGLTRADLAGILNCSIEQIAESINELLHTSLINRSGGSDADSFQLNGSVRELLLLNPRNFTFRAGVLSQLRRQSDKAREIDSRQAAKGIGPFDPRYIPPTTPVGLKELLSRVNPRIYAKRVPPEALAEFYPVMQLDSQKYHDEAVFHRAFGRLLQHLKDREGWEREYRSAIGCEPTDAVTRQMLAHALHECGDYAAEEAVCLDALQDEMAATLVLNETLRFRFHRGYLVSLLYQKKYDVLDDVTATWKEKGDLRAMYGSTRAGLIKRQIEGLAANDKLVAQGLVRAARILGDVVREDGYGSDVVKTLRNIIDEIVYRTRSANFTQVATNSEAVRELLEFAADHAYAAYREVPASLLRIIGLLVQVVSTDNPFHDERWARLEVALKSGAADSVEFEEGQLKVTVYHVPEGGAPSLRLPYVFAKDAEAKQFFIHYDIVSGLAWADWCDIHVGSVFVVQPSRDRRLPGQAVPCVAATLVE